VGNYCRIMLALKHFATKINHLLTVKSARIAHH
jgi:hypothetical protein